MRSVMLSGGITRSSKMTRGGIRHARGMASLDHLVSMEGMPASLNHRVNISAVMGSSSTIMAMIGVSSAMVLCMAETANGGGIASYDDDAKEEANVMRVTSLPAGNEQSKTRRSFSASAMPA